MVTGVQLDSYQTGRQTGILPAVVALDGPDERDHENAVHLPMPVVFETVGVKGGWLCVLAAIPALGGLQSPCGIYRIARSDRYPRRNPSSEGPAHHRDRTLRG